MKFEEFAMLIKEEYIEGLLKPFSPSVAHHKESKGHYHPRYEIGLNTGVCKFLIVCEEASGVMIAHLSSNFENTQINWFSLRKICNFVSGQPFEWEVPYKNRPYDDR